MLSRVAEAFDSIGKIAAGFAGLAVFVYLIGGAVMLARLRDADLPAEEVIPELSQQRLFVSGVIELFWTTVAAALLVLIALGAYWRAQQIRRNDTARDNESKWVGALKSGLGVLAIVLLVLAVATVPLSWTGAVWVIGLLMVVLLVSNPIVESRLSPWAVIGIAVVAATLLTTMRQLEFPSQFPGAVIVPKSADGLAAGETEAVSGRFVGATEDEVFVGVDEAESLSLSESLDLPPSLVVMPRDQIKQIVLRPRLSDPEPSDSIIEVLFDKPVVCLFPTCRLSEDLIEPALSP